MKDVSELNRILANLVYINNVPHLFYLRSSSVSCNHPTVLSYKTQMATYINSHKHPKLNYVTSHKVGEMKYILDAGYKSTYAYYGGWHIVILQ